MIMMASAELQTVADLVDALAATLEEEDCDHSVGICFCGSVRALAEGVSLLERHGRTVDLSASLRRWMEYGR